jgi:hypothetical protein
MHSHPACVAYVFGPYPGKAILQDGTEVPLNRKEVTCSTAGR